MTGDAQWVREGCPKKYGEVPALKDILLGVALCFILALFLLGLGFAAGRGWQ